MKIDAFVCALVVALTMLVPSLVYFKTATSWAKFSSESTLSADRFEQLAKDTELGKIRPDVAGFPAYLRMQAAGQRYLAEMFSNLSKAVHSLMSGTVGVAAVQAAFLGWLTFRRRRPVETPLET